MSGTSTNAPTGFFALARRAMGSEQLIAQHNAELALLREQLASEVSLRARAEDDLACIEKDAIFLHESLPAMIASLDLQRQITYHNGAFARGLGAVLNQIDGRHFREVVGEGVYAEWNADFDGAFAGNVVHREYLHKLSGGKRTRLLLQFLPQFNESGTVIRAFVLATDISDGNDASLLVEAIPSPAVAVAEVVRPSADMAADADDALDSDAVRLRTALARNEFCLFFQMIEPVVPTGEALPFREILLRLKLEEERMMPPGSFLPVAEEHNMLPDLDRWVVNQLLAWICADAARQQGVYSVNIAAQTVMDTAFPAFVKKALYDFGLPGSLLCFELQEADVLESRADSIRFVAQLKAAGCRNILCGFSGNRESLDLLRQVQVNFVKIDGSLILKMIRSGVDLARVKAIQRVARVIGISTIAECVEDNATIKLLKDIGVNFAQGFGISRPQDIRNISGDVAVEPGTDSAAIDREVAMAGR